MAFLRRYMESTSSCPFAITGLAPKSTPLPTLILALDDYAFDRVEKRQCFDYTDIKVVELQIYCERSFNSLSNLRYLCLTTSNGNSFWPSGAKSFLLMKRIDGECVISPGSVSKAQKGDRLTEELRMTTNLSLYDFLYLANDLSDAIFGSTTHAHSFEGLLGLATKKISDEMLKPSTGRPVENAMTPDILIDIVRKHNERQRRRQVANETVERCLSQRVSYNEIRRLQAMLEFYQTTRAPRLGERDGLMASRKFIEDIRRENKEVQEDRKKIRKEHREEMSLLEERYATLQKEADDLRRHLAAQDEELDRLKLATKEQDERSGRLREKVAKKCLANASRGALLDIED